MKAIPGGRTGRARPLHTVTVQEVAEAKALVIFFIVLALVVVALS